MWECNVPMVFESFYFLNDVDCHPHQQCVMVASSLQPPNGQFVTLAPCHNFATLTILTCEIFHVITLSHWCLVTHWHITILRHQHHFNTMWNHINTCRCNIVFHVNMLWNLCKGVHTPTTPTQPHIPHPK